MTQQWHSNPKHAPQQTVKYLSATELEKFFSVLRKSKSPRDEIAFVLTYAFGLRVGELVRIRLDDIKPDLTKPVEIFIKRLKNGVSRHYKLEITEKGTDLTLLLKRWLKQRSKLKYAQENQFLFCTNHSVLNHMSTLTIEQLMIKYGQLAGLPREKCHPHVLRHSCAISLLMKGADIKNVKDHLGHKSLLTTVQFYGNLGAEDWLKKSAENIKTRLFI
jgi:type 1 fimbriae regulatory protein FimB